MYTFLEEPKIIGEEEVGQHGLLRMKRAVLQGSDGHITAVAHKRHLDSTCPQSPWGEVPTSYRVEVTYLADEVDFISVRSVYVSFDDGKKWSCFFDSEHGRRGCRTVGQGGSFHFYFLEDDQGVSEVVETLWHYCDREALKILARQGPWAFEDDEEEAELVVSDFDFEEEDKEV